MESETAKINHSFSNTRIVFMGTPEFAVASLAALCKANANIVGVVTAPDRPAGRGLKPKESAVKQFARENNLPILQPEKLKDSAFLQQLQSLQADLQVVVAFRMLPELVWNMPPMGTLNLHGSLLPQYRGAAPINWAIINGERNTGVTTFKLKHAIDTGNILLQESFPIAENETAGQVHDRMKEIGADLLLKTIEGLVSGALKEIPQTDLSKTAGQVLRHAPKITTETCRIEWAKPVDEVYNLIRGLSPFPTAFTYLDGKMFKLFEVRKEKKDGNVNAGEYETDRKSFLKFRAFDGYIYVDEMQIEGKKKMKIADFLRGYKFE